MQLRACLAGIVGAVALMVQMSTQEAKAAAPCQIFYNSSVSVPVGWGAAYDVFHASHPLLANVDCTVTTIPLTVGLPTDSTVYVYQTAYLLTSDLGAMWTPITLSASQPAQGGWLLVPATAPLNLTSGQLNADWNYIAFLSARWNGSKWLIGCADAVCAASAWSLQAITRQITLTVKMTPVSANIADDTALSAVVGTISCFWSDDSPCTATFSRTDPAGIYTISGSNVIVDPAGPGVGPAGGTDRVKITATQ
jgi:type IV secretory pathway protease TraF